MPGPAVYHTTAMGPLPQCRSLALLIHLAHVHLSGELRPCRKTSAYSPSSLAKQILLVAPALVLSWYPVDGGITKRSNAIAAAAPHAFAAAVAQAQSQSQSQKRGASLSPCPSF